ncbi:MAG: SpoIIE family protein phosphatase [Clostridia bacterium]|nr:SpoIIE family protein phosphatase [Clostridia bacterium]
MASPALNMNKQQSVALRAPNRFDTLPIALLFIISRASILGVFPFSIAFFAATTDKAIAYLALTVISAGLFLSGAKILVVKYIIAFLLYWIYDKLKTKNNTVYDATACGMSLCVGGIFMIAADGGSIYSILMLIAEGLISSISYLVFKKTDMLVKTRKKREQATKDELISVVITISIVITGFWGLQFRGITLCNILSIYAVMVISYLSNLSVAGSGGLCIGFITAMGSDTAILNMGMLGMCAMFSNMLKSIGKLGALIGMIGGVGVITLYSGGQMDMPINIYEALIGAALFIATPPKMYSRLSAYFTNSLTIESIQLDTRVRDYLALKMIKISNSFLSLNSCFEETAQKRLNLYSREAGAIFDDVCERVCSNCNMANKCWKSEFSQTYKLVSNLLSTIENEGVLLEPTEEFNKHCQRANEFISEFNHVYELYKQELVHQGEAISNKELINSQYKEIATLLDRTSKMISDGFTFREDLEEAAVSFLDAHGIGVFEISVVEGVEGQLEIYAGLNIGTDIKKCESAFGQVCSVPIGYVGTEANGIMKFASKPRYSVDFATRQRCKDHGKVCGDSIKAFKTEDCRMYFLISDGMGSGKKASSESKITLTLLQEFLTAGFDVKTSIEMINSTLCLKLDNECFATVDLMMLDLMTGFCEFYKIGAAQSFIYSQGRVDTIFSASIPVGMLKSIKVSGQRRRIYDGDTVIMISDGVSEAGYTSVRTEWIKNEITNICDNMDDMADNVIHKAIKKSHDTVIDDMSVIAIRLIEN